MSFSIKTILRQSVLSLSLIGLIAVSSCGFAAKTNSTYPVHLAGGKDISDKFVTFNFEPRKLAETEMISLGINIKGNTICYDRHREFRLCSQALKDSQPDFKVPDEYRFNPDKQYTDEEKKALKSKLDEISDKFQKEYGEPWLKLMDGLPIIDLEVVAVNSAGREFPFIYVGTGAGYCGDAQADQLCSQYNLDKKKVTTLGDEPLVALKIRNKQAADIKISNCYVVERYRRD